MEKLTLMNTFIWTKQHKKRKKRTAQKTAVGLYSLAYIHQTSGTPNQQLNTAA